MCDTLLQKITRRLHDASQQGAPLLLAISGGADSSLLLHCAARGNVPSLAVHCNFHLRGDESNRDEAFVRERCRDLDVPLLVEHFDTPAYCRDHGCSVETACRELRYARFRKIAREHGCRRIVTAHNADDNVETLLLALFRGAGLQGLAGMPMDSGEILRPMIDVWRSEILDALSHLGLGHVEDSTNACSDYRRNFLRNEVIPLIATRWPAVRRTMLRTQENLRSERDTLLALTRDLTEGDTLPWSALERVPDPTTLLHGFAAKYGASRSRILEMVRAARRHTVGAAWSMESGEIRTERSGFAFTPLREVNDCFAPGELPEGYVAEVVVLTAERLETMRSDRTNRTIYLPGRLADYRFRRPREGERFEGLGVKGSKRISQILKDAALPHDRRLSQLVLTRAADDRPLWIPGVKRSRHALLKGDEQQALLITTQVQSEQTK